jgi:hypothetical protein
MRDRQRPTENLVEQRIAVFAPMPSANERRTAIVAS